MKQQHLIYIFKQSDKSTSENRLILWDVTCTIAPTIILLFASYIWCSLSNQKKTKVTVRIPIDVIFFDQVGFSMVQRRWAAVDVNQVKAKY